MPTRYQLYSRNRLLGETEFEYHTSMPRHRMGAFHPTAVGETLMPVITGVQRAFHEIALRRHARDDGDGGTSAIATLDADLAAAESHLAALELELRRADGSVVATEWIGVQDTEEMIRWSEQIEATSPERYEVGQDAELDAAVAHDMELIDEWFDEREDEDEPWEADEDRGEFPRYQISAELKEPL